MCYKPRARCLGTADCHSLTFLNPYKAVFNMAECTVIKGPPGAFGGRGERPALRPTGAACAKKGRIVGGVGCPPNCRTSGKLRGNFGEARGSSDPFELFRKMLHFGKIPKNFG